MKKGITPVIAIVLLLMMTVAVGGIAYLWFNSIQQKTQESTEESVEHVLGRLSSCMSIDSISDLGDVIYLRNCGEGQISKSFVNIYVDGKPIPPADITMEPVSISKGKVAKLTIASMPSGTTLEIKTEKGSVAKNIGG